MKDVIESIHFRHACRRFDLSKKVSRDDMKAILEAGRLAPSAWGLEPWKMIVVNQNEDLQALQRACKNQDAVATASFAVSLLTRGKNLAKPEAIYEEFVRAMPTQALAETSSKDYTPHLQKIGLPL